SPGNGDLGADGTACRSAPPPASLRLREPVAEPGEGRSRVPVVEDRQPEHGPALIMEHLVLVPVLPRPLGLEVVLAVVLDRDPPGRIGEIDEVLDPVRA